MVKKVVKQRYSCFIFGEGKRDKDFLITLIDLPKFKYHTSNWVFSYSNSSGGSAEIVLKKCHRESGYSFDLILCFIDLDKLKEDFPKKWNKKKKELEEKYTNIEIIWQTDNAEDEYKRVLGKIKGKNEINKQAKKQITKFINSKFWKRILKPIKEKEQILEQETV